MFYNYLHWTTKLDLYMNFAKNEKNLGYGEKLGCPKSIKIVYVVKYDDNCVFIIYLLWIMEATIKMNRPVVFYVA